MAENQRIKFYPDPEPMAEKVLTEWLQLPQDLRGKRVLELFSGDPCSSMMTLVMQRGGNYYSVDKGTQNGPNHIIGDVYKLKEYYPPNFFDFVIMKFPPIYGRFLTKKQHKKMKINEMHNFPNFEQVIFLLMSAMSLLKEKRGCFVGISCSIGSRDSAALYRELSQEIPHFNTKWFISAQAVGRRIRRIFLGQDGNHMLEEESGQSFRIIRK